MLLIDIQDFSKRYPAICRIKGDADQLATEAQLAALQEQLVAVMLENQHLAEEVKVLRESSATEQLRQQLDREKEKSRILMERLQEKEAKERERGDREARERERHTREKSLPAGDKSPSLPQRIRKRINQIHKPQSFEVEDGSPGPPQPPISEKTRLLGEERTNPRPGPEPPACQIVKYGGEAANHKSSSTFDVVESPSRGRFAWKRRGLEKSKSLDQSEFLASLNGAASTTSITVGGAVAGGGEGGGIGGGGGGGGGALGDTGVLGSETESGTNPAGAFPGSLLGTTVVSPKYPWWRRLEVQVVAAIGELVKDFSEVAEEELPDGDPEGDPLTVKKLKENILRFGCVMRPLTELSAAVTSLLRGWTQNVFRRLRREGHEPLDTTTSEAGLGDKFALVLQVARRVQNQLGAVSNAAEKLKNLLMWEHEAARRLYFFLWVVLLASVLLPAAQLFTLIGVYLGLKFFVMDYVFFRYPRIRLKYDSTSRLWDTLPTDADLERRGDKNRGENGNSSPDLTSFLELFSLPATEAPLPGWQSGRRCTLVNRDRSLTSAFKNGRLYLTNRLAKQDKQMASSTKLTAPTNKVTSSNKLTVSNSSKGNQSAKLSASFTSKQNIDGVRKGSLTGFSKTQSDSASLTSGFSFLSKGNKTLKARELKEYKEDDVEMLEKIFEDTGDEDSITTSRIFQTCDSARSSPQSSRSRDSSFQVWRSLSDTDAAARDSRPPSSFGKRKGLLLRSVSEQSELHPDFIDDDDTNEDNLSSYDVKITRDNKDQTEQDGEKVKPKKSRLARLKTTNTDEHKTKTSVIDKLNEKVFYAV
ncbi:GRAM domain-containing protein 4-like [Homarus americanus]|uniref:GRAM domain-containing protein 4-like n=1 Tax=Homarus americanus TaxID=6706 RepID=A0A8J5N8F5_HOMAM|nr:GRAM domain-containing protein 4-like [Homarus americanus]